MYNVSIFIILYFIETEIYKVNVSAPDNKNRYVVKAISIPTISDDITGIETKEIGKKLGLKDKIHRGKGPVDILIGIDHPSICTAEKLNKLVI